MRKFFQGFGEILSTNWAIVCIWRTNRTLKRIIRRENRISLHLSRLAKRRERLIIYQHNLNNKYSLRPLGGGYKKWLDRVASIAVIEYGFSSDVLDALDDGTYRIFYFRGYRPEHAMFEIYGPPKGNNEIPNRKKDTEEHRGKQVPLSRSNSATC